VTFTLVVTLIFSVYAMGILRHWHRPICALCFERHGRVLNHRCRADIDYTGYFTTITPTFEVKVTKITESSRTVDGAIKRPRFTGIPSFMRAPIADSFSDIDIALIGVPMDLGVTNRAGARHGPREIRNASSLMRIFNVSTGINPYDLSRIADVGDVPIENLFNLDEAIKDIAAYYRQLHATGVIPLSAGGDHSITYPIFQGIAADRPVGMIHIDAHTDTWGEFFGSKFHHGAPFRLAVQDGLLDPARTIQIGIRGGQNTLEGLEFSKSSGMRVMMMDEFSEIGVAAAIDEARSVVGDGPTYISFDVDGLDPVYAPGTGTPEIGGITTVEALKLLRGLRGLNLVGGDVVEVAPPFDQTGNTALVGASLMFEILCLLAESLSGRSDIN
jgi:guanidinopropionase